MHTKFDKLLRLSTSPSSLLSAYMKIKLLILFCILKSHLGYCSVIDTIYSDIHVQTTYFDSTENTLYAGGHGLHNLLKVENDGYSYFKPSVPFGSVNTITKYHNDLYVGGPFGVAKFDGTNWIQLSTAYLPQGVYKLFAYDDKLYAFTGYLETFLTFWDGNKWNQADPGVSSIGCMGIIEMFMHNNELYANSSENGGAAVIIKKSGSQWTFPNGQHFNIMLVSHCTFNHSLYLADGERIYEYDGKNFKWLDLWFLKPQPSESYNAIHSIRSDGKKLFIGGEINQVTGPSGNMKVKNLVSWSGENLISSINYAISSYISDFNFHNNKLYVFVNPYIFQPQIPFSINNALSELPSPEISVGDTSICQGQYLALSETSNTGIKWNWEISDTLSEVTTYSTQKIFIDTKKSGIYTLKVTVSNSDGEATKVYNNVVHILEKPSAPTVKIMGDTLVSSSLTNNHWYKDGKLLPDTSNFIVTHLNNTNTFIYVIVTNKLGCSSVSNIVTQSEVITLEKSIQVYPNPTNGLMTIKSEASTYEKYSLKLETLQGKELFTKSVEFINYYNLDLTTIPSGIYFLILQNDRNRIVKKVIINKS